MEEDACFCQNNIIMVEIKKVHKVYLSLGSNLGDKLGNLGKCMDLIKSHIGQIAERSQVYRSAAWGFQSDHAFYNMCLEIKTALSVEDLMEKVLKMEKSMGRKRSVKGYIDRIVDIDILFFDNLILESPDIVVPHPRIELRRFVLVPLAEINAAYNHPVHNRSIAELLNDCEDKNQVLPI